MNHFFIFETSLLIFIINLVESKSNNNEYKIPFGLIDNKS
jgi:hypothetical protein